MFSPIGAAELLIIVAVILAAFLLAFLFRIGRALWRRWQDHLHNRG